MRTAVDGQRRRETAEDVRTIPTSTPEDEDGLEAGSIDRTQPAKKVNSRRTLKELLMFVSSSSATARTYLRQTKPEAQELQVEDSQEPGRRAHSVCEILSRDPETATPEDCRVFQPLARTKTSGCFLTLARPDYIQRHRCQEFFGNRS